MTTLVEKKRGTIHFLRLLVYSSYVCPGVRRQRAEKSKKRIQLPERGDKEPNGQLLQGTKTLLTLTPAWSLGAVVVPVERGD